MQPDKKIVALVGSYRKKGMLDRVVDAVLAAAAEEGAAVEKIYLLDRPIAFCRNCRHCMQFPGAGRGACVLDDGMGGMLDELERADGIVLGSPINFFTVTALTKRFVERLGCYAWWPWEARGPKWRNRKRPRKAVLLLSCAMPSWMARIFCSGQRILRMAATLMGARTVGLLIIGEAARERPEPSRRVHAMARRLGRRLAND